MFPRVLITDTDPSLLESYRHYLEQRDYVVETATNGLECIAKLREFAPDILVLEPCLPWGAGDDILARMAENLDVPQVPVIVLTYGRDQGVLYRLARFDVDDYRIKPLTPRRLEERILAILGQMLQPTSMHVECAAGEH